MGPKKHDHIDFQEALYLRCGFVDRRGSLCPGRGGLADETRAISIARKTSECAPCRALARRLARSFEDVSRRTGSRQWKRKRRGRLLATAAVALLAPGLMLGLVEYHGS